MSKSSKSKYLKGAAITAGAISLVSVFIGELSYLFSLTRQGVNSKIVKGFVDRSKAKKPVDEFRQMLDNKLKAGEAWLNDQPLEKIVIERENNKNLHADFLPPEKASDVYVISSHGYKSTPHKMGIYAKEFYNMGFNVLLPSLRGHADSEEDFITMGWKDRLDLIEWINYIIKDHPDCKIILHGVSMGGATTMMATGEQLPKNVKLAIEDCGYTNAWEILGLKITSDVKLPVFPFLYYANEINKIREKFNLKKASALEQVKKSITPTLFIHGEKDTFVPFSMLQEVYDAASCIKEKIAIPDAPHARSVCAHPDMYWNAVRDFIKKHL